MHSRPLMTLRLSTAPTQNIGAGPQGTRLIFPITGGRFDGDRLRGKVLPGGDDWVVKRPDGVLELRNHTASWASPIWRARSASVGLRQGTGARAR